MKKTIIGLMVVALLATAGLAMAQGWGRGMGYGPGYGPGPNAPCYGPGCGQEYGPRGSWGADLNLTAEQNQKIQAMRESFFKENLPLRNEMQTKQLELRTLWAQTNPDQEKILAKQKEINTLRAQLQEKGTLHRLEMRKVLTPEQQAQIGAFGPGFGPGYGMRGGFGPGRGMGFAGCPRW